MSETYTLAEAAKALKQFFINNCPRRFMRGTPEALADEIELYNGTIPRGVTVHWQISFAVECSLCFGIHEETTLSWGGMQRTASEALASAILYREAAAFAVALELKRREELRRVEQSQRKGRTS